MSATDFEIADLSLEQADLAARFFHEQWRSNHIFYRDRQMLLWQYHKNPFAHLFSGGLTFRAAFNGGRSPAGVFAYMPFVFNRYGTRRFGCHLSAWWVSPEHRRSTLGLRLLHSLQHHPEFDICIAGINTPIAEKLYEKMAWTVVHAIPRVLFVTDLPRFVGLMDPHNQAHQRKLTELELHFKSLSQPRNNFQIDVRALSSLDHLADLGWDEFYWGRIAPNYVGPARELAYLRWRYSDIPIFKYEVLLATTASEIVGLLVYRVETPLNRSEKIIRIVDLISEDRANAPLITRLIQLAADQHVACVDFFCAHPPSLLAFTRLGFVDVLDVTRKHYWFPHLFQPLDHTRDTLNTSWWIRGEASGGAQRPDVYLTKGDYEFDRPN